MASEIVDALSRLRVCRAAALPIPEDLQDELILCLESVAGAAARRAERDQLIRRAALLLPESSQWGRAERLAREAKALARTRAVAGGSGSVTARTVLQEASAHAALPGTARQFYRLLVDHG